jgi:hypothetical protein
MARAEPAVRLFLPSFLHGEIPSVRHLLPFLAFLVLLTLLVMAVGCDEGSPVQKPSPGTGANLNRPGNSGNAGLGDPLVVEGDLRVEPRVFKVTGISQCAEASEHVITLHNDGEVDETVDRVISSCGCATVLLEPGTIVPAGGSVELPIVFKAWGAARRKTHDVRFILAGNRLGPLLSMDVEITSPLRSIPSALQQFLHDDGRVRILATDGEPFSVLGLEPPIPATISEGPAAQVEIVVDWSALGPWLEQNRSAVETHLTDAEDGSWDRLRLEILTDRPDCARFHLELFSPRHTSPVWNAGTSVP